jgi:hypothetical protein
MKKVHIRYTGASWIISNANNGQILGAVREPERLVESCNKQKLSVVNSDALVDVYKKQLNF